MENDIPLGPVDYLFTGAGSEPITFAFHFAGQLDPDALRAALPAVLRCFPAVQGTLARSEKDDYVFRVPDAALALETRRSPQPWADSRSISRYIAPVESRPGQPLSRLSVTETPAGSVLAVSISHALVDGFSFFHFLSSWARQCRGEQFLPPDLRREGEPFADDEGGGPAGAARPAGGFGAAAPVSPAVLLERCGLHIAEQRSSHPAGAEAREERIPLSTRRLQEMMEEAKHDQPAAAFSENDVVTAWLWQKFLPSWVRDPGDGQTWMTCPVDCRRIYKALPRRYFGCALCFASASAGLDLLRRAPLGDVALHVHSAVRGVTNDFASVSMRTLRRYRRQQGLAAMERVHLTHPRRGMVVTNLTRLPLTDLDFGAGAPDDFLVHSDVSGSAALLPAEDGIMAVVLHP